MSPLPACRANMSPLQREPDPQVTSVKGKAKSVDDPSGAKISPPLA
ncbi:MAG TPA: hypothetical protein VNI57_12225 [Candidatus Saccharimonadales bacterium]|nr:hypothetical protein [Candidatus Saccharimonadales bacterium]